MNPALGAPQPIVQQPITQTVIQINAVANPMLPRGVPRPWSTEMTDCFADMTVCLCTFFVPCYPGCIARDMDECGMFTSCAPGAFIAMRALISGRHNIQGSLCNDCVVFPFCGPCATCQLAREVQNIKTGKATP